MLGKKIIGKKCETTFFIFSRIAWQKWWKKRAKQFFQKTEYNEEKCWEKNRRNKVRNNVFYIHTNILTINCGEKNAWNNFSIHTSAMKNVRKKIFEKMRNNVFLYSHEYRDQKMGGKKRAKQFFQKHTNIAWKNVGKKNRRKKVRNNFFYIHTNIVTIN